MRCVCLLFPPLPLSFLSLNVLPAARYDTCDASSRQRSHWCCWPSCAQVQLFFDWGQHSKCIWYFLGCQSSVGVSCQCLCPAVSVECHSACSQYLCRYDVTYILLVPTRVKWYNIQNYIVRTFKSILASSPGTAACGVCGLSPSTLNSRVKAPWVWVPVSLWNENVYSK